MSDSDKKPVKRMGREQRKTRLERPDSFIPPEDLPYIPDFDLDKLGLPNNDAEALASLSRLPASELKAPVITPEEERFPALAPTASKPKAQAAQTDFSPEERAKRRRYNVMTALSILGTILSSVWLVIVWQNPQSTLNPLAPPTPFRIVTATPEGFTSGDAPISLSPSTVITTVPAGGFTYAVSYLANPNPLGCNWWSIAGQVVDSRGQALAGYRVRIRGTDLDETVFSGVAFAYGTGGYELPLLGEARVAAFSVQLLSPQAQPLSPEIAVMSQSTCEANVLVINFVQNGS